MNITETKLAGVYSIEPRNLQDERGVFIKTFHAETFAKHGLAVDFQESYYSTSHKNVIRGMHFQTPPAEHVKLVYVTRGRILDVVVDIRKSSPTYGHYISLELSEENRNAVYIAPGLAHGFLSLEDNSTVTYLQSSMYAPENDAGIRFDSFGFDWGVKNPILSPRDQQFPSLAEFTTPFS